MPFKTTLPDFFVPGVAMQSDTSRTDNKRGSCQMHRLLCSCMERRMCMHEGYVNRAGSLSAYRHACKRCRLSCSLARSLGGRESLEAGMSKLTVSRGKAEDQLDVKSQL